MGKFNIGSYETTINIGSYEDIQHGFCLSFDTDHIAFDLILMKSTGQRMRRSDIHFPTF